MYVVDDIFSIGINIKKITSTLQWTESDVHIKVEIFRPKFESHIGFVYAEH